MLAASFARGEPVSTAKSLANWVPGDVRLFVEMREMGDLLKTPSGGALLEMLETIAAMTRMTASTQPAGNLSQVAWWQEQLAQATGVKDPAVARCLFSGRLALAADGLTGGDDAIVIAEPASVPVLEPLLKQNRDRNTASIPPQASVSRSNPLRWYRLSDGRELVTDGRLVMLGRGGDANSLYARTLELWTGPHGVPLADLADFRERVSDLPERPQLLLYVNASPRPNSQQRAALQWWPAIWPQPQSAGLSFMVTADGVNLETNSRFDYRGSQWQHSNKPRPLLANLPASTIVAWSQPVNYRQEFRTASAAFPNGMFRFYVAVLESGLPSGAAEQWLLGHLVGDSVFVIAQATQPMPAPTAQESNLLLPAAAVSVKTDDPRAVEKTLKHLSANLLRLLNVQSLAGGSLSLREDEIALGAGTIQTIPIGKFFASRTTCEFLRTLEISWTVADDWLVLGTDSGLIRQVVEARRGLAPVMSLDPAAEVRADGETTASADMVLVAQPVMASEMISSWIEYLSHNHPHILKADWWSQLRQRQRAAGAQLGIIPSPNVGGGVEVAQTLPNWPAYQCLKPGDRIVAVDGQPLDARTPHQSLRGLLAARRESDCVTLRVVRGQATQDIELSMPTQDFAGDLQPAEILKQASNLLRIFSTASYGVWQPSPGVLNARLKLQFAPTTAAR